MPGPLGDGVRTNVVGETDNDKGFSSYVRGNALVQGLDYIGSLVADKKGAGYGFIQACLLYNCLIITLLPQGANHITIQKKCGATAYLGRGSAKPRIKYTMASHYLERGIIPR